jgi:L-amino acid N-acyltransferase YncA
MNIKEADETDFEAIWPIFRDIVSKGETYTYSRTTTKAEALKIWIKSPLKTYIFTDNGIVLGTYFIKPNQSGGGDHVCNCGYMVSEDARGKGIATLMCEHSQKVAKDAWYKAMQFNFVVTSNEGAIRLWNKLGFETVGRLPHAFNHPTKGYIDALIMYKWL